MFGINEEKGREEIVEIVKVIIEELKKEEN